MILVIEPIFPNALHSQVNAGILRSIVIAARAEPVAFAAHPMHRAAVMALIPSDERAKIAEIDIPVHPPGGISFKRFMLQAKTLLSLVRRLRPRAVVCVGTSPEALFALRLLATFHRSIRIIGVLHGNLDAAANNWRSRDPRRRWFDDRSSLAAAVHPSIRLAMIEPSIARVAIELGLVPADRALVWPHTILDQEIWDAPHTLSPDRVRVSFVGSARRAKGFGDFLGFAARFTTPGSGFEFEAIGALLDDFTSDELGSVRAEKRFLDRDEYLDRLRATDYVCMPLRESTYTLTASGTILDAIAARRPMIALATPAIRDVFADGPVGYLCETLEEMAAVLADREQLLDQERHDMFRDNLSNLAVKRQPREIAKTIALAL